MTKTFITITITYYNNRLLAPDVHYYKDDGVNPPISDWDMDVDTANHMMWELVKLGGENSYRSNRFDNAISVRQVLYWGQ